MHVIRVNLILYAHLHAARGTRSIESNLHTRYSTSKIRYRAAPLLAQKGVQAFKPASRQALISPRKCTHAAGFGTSSQFCPFTRQSGSAPSIARPSYAGIIPGRPRRAASGIHPPMPIQRSMALAMSCRFGAFGASQRSGIADGWLRYQKSNGHAVLL